MQCKLRFPLLQHMISISTRSMFPSQPADFDPFPAPPRPVKKIASPSIPAKITQEDGMVRYPTLSDLSVTSRSTRALISWANSWVLPQIWECCEKGEVPIVFFKPRAGGRVWRARELQREVRQPWAARLGRQRCAHWGGRPGTVHAVCSFRQDVRWAVYIIIFYSLFVHKGKEPCYTKCSGRN